MFSLWLYFACKELFFRTNIVTVLKCLRKWKPFLVSCGQTSEPCSHFRGLIWGIEFWLRSEISYAKSQSLVGNGAQVSRFGPLIPSKNFVDFHLGTRINKSMSKQKITLFFFHIGNSDSSMLNLLNKMDQENKNSENRFIVQCTLCIFTNKRSANKFSLFFVKKRGSIIVLIVLRV